MRLVPSATLIVLVLLAAAAAAVAGPLGFVLLAPLAAAGVALLALLDAWLALRQGGWPEPLLPPIVRLTHGREGRVPLQLRTDGAARLGLRLAFAFPEESSIPTIEERVHLARGDARHAEAITLDLPCHAPRRGRFRGGVVSLERRSPGGLWLVRRRTVPATEWRVYPNLLAEGREAAALFLPRHPAGHQARRQAGRGREFEKLRDYLPGDGFDEVHWKASAKRSRPVTKVFQVERTQEVLVVIDASRLSARPLAWKGGIETTLDRSLAAALSLLTAAERQGDRFGLAAFDSRVRTFLPAGGGPAHYDACRDAALQLASADVVPDMAEIVRFLRTRVRRRTLLFFLTDLADPVLAEDFLKQAPLLTRQHLVVVGQLQSADTAPLFSGAPVQDAGDIYGRLARHIRWKELRGVTRRLRPTGAGVALLEPETMAADVVRRYLEIKQRSAL